MLFFQSKPRFSHTLQALAASLLIAFGNPAQAQPRLPSMGDALELTSSAERHMGDRIIRELYRDPDYIDDAVLHEYVQHLVTTLVQAAQKRGELADDLQERFAFEVLLGRDRTVNAFALPGGYLGVHLGLLAVVSSGDELASVLAHEVSHVTQRHIARLMAQQGRTTPLVLASMVLGALAASRSPEAAQALMIGGQALAVQNQLNFSRDMEREADRIGFGLMQPAGFAPQGFVSMFDKLQQANRINDNGSWPYLRSHPLTTQRIADMHSRLPPGAAAPQPTLEHVMLSARARVLMRTSVDAQRQALAEPQEIGFAARPQAQRVAAWYAACLSALQLQDLQAARRAWDGLQAAIDTSTGTSTGTSTSGDDNAAQRQLRLLGAELELAASQPQAALAQLDRLDAASRPELLLRAQALLRLGRGADLAERLQTWVALHPRDSAAWQALAQLWQQQGQGLRAIRAEAEAQVARYDYAAAIDRFKAGQELARRSRPDGAGHIDASIIDTRLRAVEGLLKEQLLEQ